MLFCSRNQGFGHAIVSPNVGCKVDSRRKNKSQAFLGTRAETITQNGAEGQRYPARSLESSTLYGERHTFSRGQARSAGESCLDSTVAKMPEMATRRGLCGTCLRGLNGTRAGARSELPPLSPEEDSGLLLKREGAWPRMSTAIEPSPAPVRFLPLSGTRSSAEEETALCARGGCQKVSSYQKMQSMVSDGAGREATAPVCGSCRTTTGAKNLEMDVEEAICGICLCSLSEAGGGARYELECGHAYHTSCIIAWFRRKNSRGACPACRSAPGPASGAGPELGVGDAGPAGGEPLGSGSPSSEGSDDVDAVLVLTETEMHRVCAHVIYRSSASRPPWEEHVVSTYMAARRRLRTARRRDPRGRLSHSQLQRAYTAAARKLLAYVSWRDGLAMLEMSTDVM